MSVVKKEIIFVLILWTKFNPLELPLYPLELDVMANLKNEEFIAIAAFENSSKLAPYISELSKPDWPWSHFHEGSFRLPNAVLEQKMPLSKVVMFPSSLENFP